MKTSKVRLITDTAIGAALCSLLLVMVMYVPFIRVLGVFICGAPLMYLSCKRGIISSVVSVLIALVAIIILTGDILTSALLVLSYAFPGLAFGIAASKKTDTATMVLASAAAVMAGFILELVIINADDGMRNILNEIMHQFSQSIENSVASINQNLPEDLPFLINRLLNEFVETFMRFLPSLFIVTALFYGYVISAFGVCLLRRINVADIPFKKFSQVRAPGFVCNIAIILYLVSIIGNSENMFIAAVSNLVVISAAILGFCGLSTIDYYFKRKIKAGVARFIIYIAAFTFLLTIAPFVIGFLPMVGYIDSKGIMRKELEENEYEEK